MVHVCDTLRLTFASSYVKIPQPMAKLQSGQESRKTDVKTNGWTRANLNVSLSESVGKIIYKQKNDKKGWSGQKERKYDTRERNEILMFTALVRSVERKQLVG